MGGCRDDEEDVMMIVSSCRSARQLPPPRRCRCSSSLALPLLLGGALATAVLLLPPCRAAEASDDKDSRFGYAIPKTKLETMNYPEEYRGDWVVVKVERLPLWRRPLRKYATKPRRVKKLLRDGLKVFEMKCFVLDEPLRREVGGRKSPTNDQGDIFTERMTQCSLNLRSIKGRSFDASIRYTYAIAEDYKPWIVNHIRTAHPNHLREKPYASVSIYYNCQRRGVGDSDDYKCHGDSVSEFYPALVHQYHHDTLTVDFRDENKVEGGAEESPAISFGEVADRVKVTPGKGWVLSQVPLELQSETSDGFDHFNEQSEDNRVAKAIRTHYLSRPELQFGEAWEEMEGKWMLNKASTFHPKSLSFDVKTKDAKIRLDTYKADKSRTVQFSVLDIPEIYLYTPSGMTLSSGRGRNRTRNKGEYHPMLHIRLQKRRFWKVAIEKDRSRQRWMVTCGTDWLTIARCLHKHKAQWEGNIGIEVFLSSNDFKLLKSFVYSTAKREVKAEFAGLGFLSDLQHWYYVLEGGWTGKTKLLEPEDHTSSQERAGKQEDHTSRQKRASVIMAGVTKSPVLESKFTLPLAPSYMKVVAALPSVMIDDDSEKIVCAGELRVTFDPMKVHLSYQSGDPSWERIDYNDGNSAEGQVVLTFGLTERIIDDKRMGRQQSLPWEWEGVQIQSRTIRQMGATIECPEQSDQFHERVRRANRLAFMWQHYINLASPRLTDDVSPTAKTGWFRKLFRMT